ncbi:MAG TPA: Uma2 family endonuclease [Granulicella sp.]|jgi:Uma2 family endonuclease|nr:Uma2 family endonuclease [Granulicella sp.]
MATTSQVPVELYLKSSYEPDAEYVDGHIEERPMGEFDHASWQQAIQLWFTQHARDWNIRVRPELRVQVSPTNCRVPDVVVFDRDHPIEQILTRPPIAVFEILSAEDAIPRMLRKLADYEQMGVPTIIVVDPGPRLVYQYQSDNLGRLTTPVLQLAGSRGYVDWQKLQELLD